MKHFKMLLLLIFVSGCITGSTTKDIRDGPFVVVKIIDGDTIDLNNSMRIRLSGINTPETGECYYQEAKDKLEELVLNKEVYLEKDKSDKDNYGRFLRYVYLDNILINSYLVENGFAKVYDKYKEDTKRYNELKLKEEKVKNLGVWVCKDLKEECLYVGSKKSNKYHLPDCKWAKKIKSDNLVCYKSEEEVKDLEKCKTCLG